MSALSKYNESLQNPPKRGQGLHQWALKVAMLGVMAEIPLQTIITEGEQKLVGLKPREMEQAVRKASNSTVTSDFVPKPEKPLYAPVIKNPLDAFISGQSSDLAELQRKAPLDVSGVSPADMPYVLLETLYDPNESLFIGDVYTKEVLQVWQWLERDLSLYPHIIPNPMSGKVEQTTEGKDSMRCEAAVSDMRYAVCEMDEVSLDKQVSFWLKCIQIKLPVAAVIHSGGKSLHGWIKVGCGDDHEKWAKDVKGWLFNEFGVKFGFDKACSNKARLSRLVRHDRGEGRIQKLLYLNGAV